MLVSTAPTGAPHAHVDGARGFKVVARTVVQRAYIQTRVCGCVPSIFGASLHDVRALQPESYKTYRSTSYIILFFSFFLLCSGQRFYNEKGTTAFLLSWTFESTFVHPRSNCCLRTTTKKKVLCWPSCVTSADALNLHSKGTPSKNKWNDSTPTCY